MTTKTDQIREALRERYPGGIPHGRQRDLADEFGVSRQLVHQVAAGLDLHTVPARRRLRAIIEARIAELRAELDHKGALFYGGFDEHGESLTLVQRQAAGNRAARVDAQLTILQEVLAKADRLAGVQR